MIALLSGHTLLGAGEVRTKLSYEEAAARSLNRHRVGFYRPGGNKGVIQESSVEPKDRNRERIPKKEV